MRKDFLGQYALRLSRDSVRSFDYKSFKALRGGVLEFEV